MLVFQGLSSNSFVPILREMTATLGTWTYLIPSGTARGKSRAHICQTWADSHDGRGRMPDPESYQTSDRQGAAQAGALQDTVRRQRRSFRIIGGCTRENIEAEVA